jgi:hypothetical protein
MKSLITDQFKILSLKIDPVPREFDDVMSEIEDFEATQSASPKTKNKLKSYTISYFRFFNPIIYFSGEANTQAFYLLLVKYFLAKISSL